MRLRLVSMVLLLAIGGGPWIYRQYNKGPSGSLLPVPDRAGRVPTPVPSGPPRTARTESHLLQRALDAVRQTESVRELLKDPRHSLQEVAEIQELGVKTVKFQHSYKGLEVIGSMVMYHEGPSGPQVNGKPARFDLNTDPVVSAQDAEQLALSQARGKKLAQLPTLKILPSKDRLSARLVYEVKVASQGLETAHEVLIDAHSGALVADISRTGPFDPLARLGRKP